MSAAASEMPSKSVSRLAIFAADIKLSHSIFAMPWAILATCMAALPGSPKIGQLALIVLCMIFARTAAMGANRLFDAKIDMKNPRTAARAIPSGKLSTSYVAVIILISSLFFNASASLFGFVYGNWLPLISALPVLLFICAYPFFKRFTRWCHYYLGICLALAPICAWVAIAGTLSTEPLLMAGAVMLWTAGFDIIYACLDYQSDLQTGVYSIPSQFGIPGALWISRLTHLGCIGLLVMLGMISETLSTYYAIGVGIAVLLLTCEHIIVRPGRLGNIKLAFFTLNGVISLVIGFLGVLDVYF